MGFRFGKGFRLGAGIRLNVSRRGLGFSAGMKGLRISVGPRGTRFTATLPGTGLSFTQQIGGAGPRRRQASGAHRSSAATSERYPPASGTSLSQPPPPTPGLFAPAHERSLVKGLNALQVDDRIAALTHFQAAASQEPSAALLAALLLAQGAGNKYLAIRMLESVLRWEHTFPTPLMEKYLVAATFRIDITPHSSALVPLGELLATLLLAELYQENQQHEEAIGLLEEVQELAGEPAITLSLCELYVQAGLWDGVLERAQGVAVVDDATLETAILFARALGNSGMHEGAIAVLSDALRTRKDRNPLLLREARYWRALAYGVMGRKVQARREMEKLYAEDRSFRDVAHRLTTLA